MSRAIVTIRTIADRALVARWAGQVPEGTRFEIKPQRRTTDQNAAMWAALTDIARQLPWHGMKLTTNDWKLLFLDALKREVRAVPNIDGTGFVNIGTSSSDLSKAEFSDLLEIIFAFGASHGVKFSEPCALAPLAQENSGDSSPVSYYESGEPPSPAPAASDPAGVASGASAHAPLAIHSARGL